MPVAVQLSQVSIHYGLLPAVTELTLEVQRGELFGLLGPNGSGKSSALGAVAGLLEPVSGTIAVEGKQRHADPIAYARQLGYVPQEPALYGELSVWDNLCFFGRLYDLRGEQLRQRVQRALEQVRMVEQRRRLVTNLSGGMQRRVNLAGALLHDPPVLLLDEPSAALDPSCREDLFAILSRLREQGHTILLTTHLLDEAEQWCDRVGYLCQGILTAVGRPAELIKARRQTIVLYGHLRDHLAGYRQRALRQALTPIADLEVTGRRVRLTARDRRELGQALAVLLAEGVDLDSFRTPVARLESLFQPQARSA